VSAPAISVRGIARDFQAGQQVVRVLHGITLDVRPGELTYLVGESGSGKTTLISIMCGILFPTEGTVEVFGTDIYALSDSALVDFRLRNIGFIFQQYNLIPPSTAASNAAVPLIAQGMDRLAARERAREIMHAPQHRRPGGQASEPALRRAAAAGRDRARARPPPAPGRVRRADRRPSTPGPGRRVMDLLREVAVAEDRSVIIVTHDNRIFDLADRILILEDGRITHDGTSVPAEGMSQ
jgi:putative ABC transport system ATP-binding protein